MNTQQIKKSIVKPASLFSLLAVISMILAACAPSVQAVEGDTTSAPVSNQTTIAANPAPSIPAGEVEIKVATDPTLGQILVDGNGMTLYIFIVDEADKSNCDAACLQVWPPLLTQGSPVLGEEVDSSLIGNTSMADGTKIVTYNHMPLYYYIQDHSAGDTTGQGVGSVWYVVSPDGKPVGVEGTTSSESAPAASFTEPTLNVGADPALGQFLVDGKGMTLYIFANDERDKSNCDADCLAKWPPLLTQGNPSVGAGVDASQVGFTTLSDGSKIVTYDHRPLYYWINDTKPGDIAGQGVGGVWWVISPSGQEIDDSANPVPDPEPAAPSASANEVTLNVASNSTLGEFLVDGKGMTLYMYTRDTADTSNCSDDCLVSWPPFLTQGNPILGPGVDDSKVGTTTLVDGSKIVTYNHMPLYYWIKDTKPGDTTGQGVGSVWYVVSPDGEIIGK